MGSTGDFFRERQEAGQTHDTTDVDSMNTGYEAARFATSNTAIDWVASQSTAPLPVVSAKTPVRPAHSDTQSVGATRRVAFNTLIQVVGKLIGYASGFVILGLTTRLLSLNQYGDYTIASTYLLFVYTLADVGVTLIAVREASKSPDDLNDVVSNAVSLKSILAIVAYVGFLAVIRFLPYSSDVQIAALILAVSMFLMSIGSGFDIAFQSTLRMQVPTMADLALKLCSLSGIGGLYWFSQRAHMDGHTTFLSVIGVFAGANALSFLIRWFGARRLLELRLRVHPRYWWHLLRVAIPMGVVTILGQIHYKADTIILSLLTPASAVAVYGVAYKLVDFLLMFFGIFVSMVYPVLARYSATSDERLKNAFVRVLNVCISLALPAATGTMLLASGIVFIAGGGKYADAALALRILAIAPAFSFVNMVYNYLIVIQNRQRNLIWVSCIGIAANVSLNLYAIPRYSYVGSAVATVTTEGLGMVLSIIIATRAMPVGPKWSMVVKSVIACLAMAAVVIGLQHTILPGDSVLETILLAAGGASAWALVLYVIRGFDEEIMGAITARIPGLRRLRRDTAATSTDPSNESAEVSKVKTHTMATNTLATGESGQTGPLVSIIIPTYNRASLVGNAIRSALNQTYQPCEVIVVDDGSGDNTAEVVSAFGSRVRYLRQQNSGVEAAMNAGAQVMTGEYLCFLGDDDLLQATTIADEMAVMRSDSTTGLVFGLSEVVESGKVVKTIKPPYERTPGVAHGTDELRHLCFTNYITGSATLIRREAFHAAGGFNPDCHGMCEDWDLWVRIACRWSIGYVPRVVQSVNVTPGHLLGQIKDAKLYGLLANHRRIVDTILSDPYAGPALASQRARIQASWLVASSSVAYKMGTIQEARDILAQAQAIYPNVFSDPEIPGATPLRKRLRIPSPVVQLARSVRGR